MRIAAIVALFSMTYAVQLGEGYNYLNSWYNSLEAINSVYNPWDIPLGVQKQP